MHRKLNYSKVGPRQSRHDCTMADTRISRRPRALQERLNMPTYPSCIDSSITSSPMADRCLVAAR